MKFLGILVSSCFLLSNAISKPRGLVFPIPNWKWITVNETGESCGIDFKKKLKVINILSNTQTQVMYLTDDGGGTECDNETTFSISTQELLSYPDLYAKKLLEEKRLKHDVLEILKGNTPTQQGDLTVGMIKEVSQWEWVNIVFPLKGENEYGEYFGNTCGVESGGQIKLIGFTSLKEEVWGYISANSGIATECSDFIMFIKRKT